MYNREQQALFNIYFYLSSILYNLSQDEGISSEQIQT